VSVLKADDELSGYEPAAGNVRQKKKAKIKEAGFISIGRAAAPNGQGWNVTVRYPLGARKEGAVDSRIGGSASLRNAPKVVKPGNDLIALSL
jgi:hypothetical protein